MTGPAAGAPGAAEADARWAAASARIAGILADALPRVAPAAVVAVRHRGRLVVEQAAGVADPEGDGRPADPALRFDLASLTKLVTATAVLQLVSAGRLGLDDRLVALLPELASPTPRTVDGGQEPITRVMLPTPPERRWWTVDPAAVTVAQLLAHTSGLVPWRSLFHVIGPVPPPPPAPDPVARPDRLDAALAAIRTYPFVDRPGAAIRYSDIGFILLGTIVERLDGVALDEALARRVAVPLGLGSLGYRPLDGGLERAAVAPTSIDPVWRRRRSHGEVEDENASALGGISGHAGLFASAADVAAFGQAWLDGDARLAIAPAVRAEALREQAADAADRRGLGWQLRRAAGPAPADAEPAGLDAVGPRAFGHTGFTGTVLSVDPDADLVVAVLTNRVWAGRATTGIGALQAGIHAIAHEAATGHAAATAAATDRPAAR